MTPVTPSTPAPPRLRIRVTNAAETHLRSGHPWLYADSVREQNRPGNCGELGVVYDRQDKFLAIGLYDPDSPLRLRVLHAGKPITLDDTWWQNRFQACCDKRRAVFDEQTTGFRWLHGESDGWPGLVLDRYDRTLVLKLYTAAWFPRLAQILELITTNLSPERIILRLSRNIQEKALQDSQLTDGTALRGDKPEAPVVFLENGVRFEAEVVRGQKTGFFLDQRENRQRVGRLAKGRDMLNAFSFSGGFSLYAAKAGAKSVTDLDISRHALDSARRNFALNQADPNVAQCRQETVQADAFEWLEQPQAPKYDLVVLDPPSLAKREAERLRAVQAYERLVRGGLQRLRPGGVLLAASCSAHVTADEFFSAVRQTARDSGRPFRELETTRHPVDHPATFAEAHYLKGIYLQF